MWFMTASFKTTLIRKYTTLSALVVNFKNAKHAYFSIFLGFINCLENIILEMLANAQNFLSELERACPIRICTLLDDAGKEFAYCLFGLQSALQNDNMKSKSCAVFLALTTCSTHQNRRKGTEWPSALTVVSVR